MGQYTYVAITPQGKEKKGNIAAADEAKAKMLLKRDGLLPISIIPAGALTRDINISFGALVKPRELAVFCRQFQSILNAGVTIIDALKMLAEQTGNKAFKKALIETVTAVGQGETLGDAMRQNPKIFPDILINLVDAGEASGSMDKVFARMATHFEKSARTKALVKKAMVYPTVLIVVAVVVIIVMSVVVFPQFANMFADMGSDLPGITKVVMAFSDFLIHRWYVLLGAVVFILLSVRFFAATDAGKHVFGRLSLRIPVFGKMNVKNASAMFSRTLGTLISSGMQLSESLTITAHSMGNVLFKDALLEAKFEVEQGISLSKAVRECGLFPPMVCQMLYIGEETGNIEEMLTKVAEYYEEEVEIQTQSLSAAMEPLIIVVMGGIVAFLVLAMYMPMIDMYSNMDNL